ncbi:hypothetical protein EXIGLDRAFT_706620 [Exidia glandulosa HHB12029]|uniref:Uncharacterized protein n=1 Tax=Exidia glandulosa HHB12029 TaxID=1314781 RepID=A0A165PNT6_EXIGL|nr:hypothetical protein EXIGLDRAFT_706620 [Exidia glandulosa HHB12029]
MSGATYIVDLRKDKICPAWSVPSDLRERQIDKSTDLPKDVDNLHISKFGAETVNMQIAVMELDNDGVQTIALHTIKEIGVPTLHEKHCLEICWNVVKCTELVKVIMSVEPNAKALKEWCWMREDLDPLETKDTLDTLSLHKEVQVLNASVLIGPVRSGGRPSRLRFASKSGNAVADTLAKSGSDTDTLDD